MPRPILLTNNKYYNETNKKYKKKIPSINFRVYQVKNAKSDSLLIIEIEWCTGSTCIDVTSAFMQVELFASYGN